MPSAPKPAPTAGRIIVSAWPPLEQESMYVTSILQYWSVFPKRAETREYFQKHVFTWLPQVQHDCNQAAWAQRCLQSWQHNRYESARLHLAEDIKFPALLNTDLHYKLAPLLSHRITISECKRWEYIKSTFKFYLPNRSLHRSTIWFATSDKQMHHWLTSSPTHVQNENAYSSVTNCLYNSHDHRSTYLCQQFFSSQG